MSTFSLTSLIHETLENEWQWYDADNGNDYGDDDDDDEWCNNVTREKWLQHW